MTAEVAPEDARFSRILDGIETAHRDEGNARVLRGCEQRCCARNLQKEAHFAEDCAGLQRSDLPLPLDDIDAAVENEPDHMLGGLLPDELVAEFAGDFDGVAEDRMDRRLAQAAEEIEIEIDLLGPRDDPDVEA